MAVGRGVVKAFRSLSAIPQTAGLLPPRSCGVPVQTVFQSRCRFPSSAGDPCRRAGAMVRGRYLVAALIRAGWSVPLLVAGTSAGVRGQAATEPASAPDAAALRPEERRVGKESRSR